MIGDELTFELKEETAVILLENMPRNASEFAFLTTGLFEVCCEIRRRTDIRVVVIKMSIDKIFSVNAYLSSRNGTQPDGFLCFCEEIARLEQPVIISVSGFCVGFGLELILACDIRIAAEDACFGLPQIKEGLIPLDGSTQRLPRLVGKSKALEMILTGETIDAQEAFRIGLVNRIVAKEDILKVTMKMAEEMSSKGPIALRYAKEAVLKGMDMTLEQGLRLEADLYLLLHTSKDRTEGITAFREKRKPSFEGK